MFRTALVRTAASASRIAARPVASASARAPILRVALPATSRIAAFKTVRMYSAASGLKKDEVEGRIMGILQSFDKVNDTSNIPITAVGNPPSVPEQDRGILADSVLCKQIKPTAHFANDLGLDSLDTVEVVMAIEEEFSIEIPDKDADGIHSVDKAVEYIVSQPDAN
ncbi:hypothetical protein TruAng_004134 [Truncatella angustata]|nr:hypothetical protein TruAng_004134 [Truncatella angustata]